MYFFLKKGFNDINEEKYILKRVIEFFFFFFQKTEDYVLRPNSSSLQILCLFICIELL